MVTIGRDPSSNILIGEQWDTVSNNHAGIDMRDDVLVFYDHSTNGTIINGQKLHNNNVEIYPGDRIMLAGVYELPWDDIQRFFPSVRRPTVSRNIRGGNGYDDGEKSAGRSSGTPYQPQSYSQEPVGQQWQQQGGTVRQQDDNQGYFNGHRTQPMDGNGFSGQATEPFQYGGQATQPFGDGGRKTEPMDEGFSGRKTVEKDYKGGQSGFGYETHYVDDAPSYTAADIDRETGKWNWGAFFCTWIWAVYHKCYWPLLIIIVGFIPYAGQVAGLFLAVYLGMHGSKIAWKSGRYKDLDAYRKGRRRWTVAGIILFILAVAINALAMYAILDLI